MKNRVLSFALVLVMCLALLPNAALAVDWAEVEWSDLPFMEEDTGEEFVIQKELFTGSYLSKDGLILYNENGKMIPEIKYNALIYYNGPGGAVVIPNGVEYIHPTAFSGSENLKSITIPDSVTEIGGGAFRGCKNLTNFTIGKGLTEISNQMFFGCESLTSITIPDHITTIGEWAFHDCASLSSVTIGKGVTTIKTRAFANCFSLKSMIIPANVTSLSIYAFADARGGTTGPRKDFIVYGIVGSEAEKASRDSFHQYYTFVAMDGETKDPTKPVTPPPANAAAKPTASTVLVNGKNVAFDAYNIGGNNYFKLRDLAYTLSGSAKQFEVTWDGTKNAINLLSGTAYTAVGGEMTGKGAGDKDAALTTSKIYLDGNEATLTAYNIGGNNYFKLRDIGQAFNFGVTWDGTKNTIVIDTSIDYIPE